VELALPRDLPLVRADPAQLERVFANLLANAVRFSPVGTPVRVTAAVGGGSVIDTAKAADLYATHPAPFERYVNAPLGEGVPVPGPLAPHIACPTTSGTGSECWQRLSAC